jgi:hypothetical protein
MRNTLFLSIVASLISSLLFAEEENMRARLGEMLKEDTQKARETEKTKMATAKSADPAGQVATAEKKKDDKVVTLPGVQVKGRKIPAETETTYEAKLTVIKIDKEIEREKKNTQPTNLDTKLNPDNTSYLGNRSAAISAEEAKQRIHDLEVKQSVAAVAAAPGSEEENKKLLDMLKDLEYQKNRDNSPERKE